MAFVLDKPQSSTETFIFIKLQLVSGPCKISTRQKCHPVHWNKTLHRIDYSGTDKALRENYKATNSILNQLEHYIQTVNRDSKYTSKFLTADMLKQEVNRLTGKLKDTITHNFISGSEKIIEKMKNGQLLTPKGKRYSSGTIKNLLLTLNILQKFSQQTRTSINYAAVTMQTYHRFIDYCYQQQYSMNFTGSQVKNWKTLLREACQAGYHHNTIYTKPEFKKLSEETFDIAFTIEELNLIYEKNLQGTAALCRDWFIIGAFTGLRVVDLKRLNKQNLQGNNIIISTEKTDERVIIPMHEYVRNIVKKYRGFPPKIGEAEINKQIKQVARAAKIKQRVLYTVTEGGIRKDYYLEKWQMASCHTARRSFITNARANGLPDAIVMKLAGIKDVKTLMRYDKLSQQQAAQIAAQHEFFK